MEFFNKFGIEPAKMFKTIGLGVVGIIVVVFLFNLIGGALPTLRLGSGGGMVAPMLGGVAYDSSYSESPASYTKGMPVTTLSTRNIGIYPPRPQTPTGNTAEDFEVTDYNATIETRRKADTCATVAGWKSLQYVIFENANESDTNCSYTFKVEHAKTAEILAKIKALDPKDLNESTYTIKRQIDDFTSEVDILEKKRKSIDETLSSALTAYDQITALATRTQDVASLAKIIDSKIQIIERLTQERININSQLDRLAQAKAEQLDKLEYTYFSVYIYENKFVDGESLADSWKQAVRNFVYQINSAIQSATLTLIAFVIGLIPYLLYALILVVVAKYGWKAVKYIWQR